MSKSHGQKEIRPPLHKSPILHQSRDGPSEDTPDLIFHAVSMDRAIYPVQYRETEECDGYVLQGSVQASFKLGKYFSNLNNSPIINLFDG